MIWNRHGCVLVIGEYVIFNFRAKFAVYCQGFFVCIKKSERIKMDSSIKSLTITGSAAEDAMKPRRGVGGRSLSRKKKPGIEAEQSEEYEHIQPDAKRIVFGNRPPIAPIAPVAPIAPIAPMTPVAPIAPIAPMVATARMATTFPMPSASMTPLQEGGKVILNPPKNQKVKLQPKLQTRIQPKAHSTNHTRKARRVHLVNISQRLTRAKRVRDDI